jgi:hypothetical protein
MDYLDALVVHLDKNDEERGEALLCLTGSRVERVSDFAIAKSDAKVSNA